MHLKVESSGTAYPQTWLTGTLVELAQSISLLLQPFAMRFFDPCGIQSYAYS